MSLLDSGLRRNDGENVRKNLLMGGSEMMVKRASGEVVRVSIDLNFANEATKSFDFLGGFGFKRLQVDATLVRYRKSGMEVDVYHGRKSFELGFEISFGGERYSLQTIMRVSDPIAANAYRKYAATTLEGVREGLEQLSAMVKTFAPRALRGEAEFFALLDEKKHTWSYEYALDVLAEQVRPMAESAFKRKEYSEVVELYGKILPRLTAAELKRLDISRVRAARI
ncbi:hypothetical protein ABZR86_16645 [Dyella marensis]|nr:MULTISPECIES: hypothetical protein [Dyella]